jgi:outer membrane protein assembly factor BamD (BamD/ComL family)
LAEENRLFARARAALIDEQPEQALARLAEHARRFPEGVLSEERQALRAVALCEAGRDADGDAAAQAFLREHPQAALAQRVRSACLE